MEVDSEEVWENKKRIAAICVMASCLKILDILRKARMPVPRTLSLHRNYDRTHYIHSIIDSSDIACINMIRMNIACFRYLCDTLRTRGLLRDTIYVTVEEQLCVFLHTIGHSIRNRVICLNFFRSSDTINRYFTRVLRAIRSLKGDYVQAPTSIVPNEIGSNPRFWPWFKDCVGAIDGTHVYASVLKDVRGRFRGRKDFPTQNVLAAVNFDLTFSYVLVRWEGSTHDLRVLKDALERPNGLKVLEEKCYLVDAGYTTKPGIVALYSNMRYHLTEFNDHNPLRNAEELFNYRHSSLRTTVERAFGALKNRFALLDCKKNKFPYLVQVDLVLVCCVLHNMIIRFDPDDQILAETGVDKDDKLNALRRRQLTRVEESQSNREWCDLRDRIVVDMWNGH